jgi:RNA polymerase primary sigma factor
MNNLKEIQQIKLLIAKGKKNGFLTFEEVGKTLPTEMNTPDQLEEVMSIFDQMNIVIVDSEENGKKLTSETADTDEELDLAPSDGDDAADYSSRSTDPVRMYLREMGAVPLLDREGEVVIAKKIENGELDVLYALCGGARCRGGTRPGGRGPQEHPHQA